MVHWWVFWVAVFVIPGSLCAKPRKGKGKGKKDDIEEQRDLLAAPEQYDGREGAWRWVRAMTVSKAQIKVNRIDLSNAPALALHMSILTVDGSGMLLPLTDGEKLERLELLLASGDEARPEPILRLEKGLQVPDHDTIAEMNEDDEDRPPLATLTTMADEGLPLDVVVVAAGHAGFRDVERLEGEHKAAVADLLGKLGDAHLNVIRYGPMLYTYRPFEGMERVMSRFDENLGLCERERLRLRVEAARRRELGEEAEAEKPLPEPPCGLFAGKGGDMRSALDRLPMRGKHARLFGIDRTGIHACAEEVYSSTALRFADLDDIEQRTFDAGAFEEALRMIVRYGRPHSRRAIVVLGDGRDGFLDDDVMCRRLFTSSNKFCAKAAGGKRGKAGREAIQACVQKKLDERATVMQERWLERATEWLALLRAADIKVYAVAYNFTRGDDHPVSHPYERERLELLALKSGGTYREVFKTRDLGDAAVATANEIRSEWVLKVADVLVSERKYKVSVKAKVEVGGKPSTIHSLLEYEFEAPFLGAGFWHWVKARNAWLKMKVGTVLYWVIVVAAILIVLLLLWLLFKLVKALVMTIVKAVAKKGTAAAKSAAKGG